MPALRPTRRPLESRRPRHRTHPTRRAGARLRRRALARGLAAQSSRYAYWRSASRTARGNPRRCLSEAAATRGQRRVRLAVQPAGRAVGRGRSRRRFGRVAQRWHRRRCRVAGSTPRRRRRAEHGLRLVAKRLRFCVTVASGPRSACNDNWHTSQHHHCRAGGAQQHSGESPAPMTADHHELSPLGSVDE